MDNSVRLTLGSVSHHIVNSLIVIMCALMCTTSCEKVQSASSDTEKTEWGYERKNGPDVWAQLSSEYVLCAEGRNQSPIDLANPISAKLPAIAYEYHQTTDLNIRNTGHTIEVAYPEGNWIEIDDTQYQLLQFHFHAPSEHTIEGKPFDMEMHLVHKSEEGNLAVVGLLIESGRRNFTFDPVWYHLPAVPGKTQRVEVSEKHLIDPAMMLSPNGQITDEARRHFSNYYRYKGSLTTPPVQKVSNGLY